ncbi:MAG: response regulator [Alphaproteobacteria bacterium]|nr:response regulator [Alphaproteobacteria bacterium]
MQVVKMTSKARVIEDISQTQAKPDGFALYVRLAHVAAARYAAAVQAMSGLLDSAGARTCYLLPNYDMLALGAAPLPVIASRVRENLSFLLAEDMPRESEPLSTLFLSAEMDTLRALIGKCYGEGKPPPSQLLPACDIDQDKLRAARVQRASPARLCVLVAEDERFSRQLVVEILGRDIDTLPAANGVEALQLYEAHAPDIVFLDIDLPRVDGHAVLERIAQADAEAFVVMLTAHHTQEDVQRALKHRAKGYIVKPFTRRKIAQYLNLYRQDFPQRNSV